MVQSVEQWYKQLPVVTRTYVTLAFLTTAGCSLEIITPWKLYYNTNAIFSKGEVWRLATNFLYFGKLDLDFVFHMFFLVKYCKSLEEGSFRGRSADFLWMLMFGATIMLAVAPFVGIDFLGSSLMFMMVYVWGRRHPYVNLGFLGVFTFTAPYLAWVLLAFSVVLGGNPLVDILGMAAGHAYYFLEDVYPRMTHRRPLKTPGLIKALFPPEDGPRVRIVNEPAPVPAPAAAPAPAAGGGEDGAPAAPGQAANAAGWAAAFAAGPAPGPPGAAAEHAHAD